MILVQIRFKVFFLNLIYIFFKKEFLSAGFFLLI